MRREIPPVQIAESTQNGFTNYHHGDWWVNAKEIPLMVSEFWKEFPSWWVNAEPHGESMLKGISSWWVNSERNSLHDESMLKGIPFTVCHCRMKFPSWSINAEWNSPNGESLPNKIPLMVSQCRIKFPAWSFWMGKAYILWSLKSYLNPLKNVVHKYSKNGNHEFNSQ